MSAPTVTEKSLSSTFPKGEIAWRGMQSGTQREISDGLAIQINRDRENAKAIITDFFPWVTTLLKEWEETFKLPTGELLTQEQRADRLIAAFTKVSPASYTGMNEIYALSGIPVIARPLLPTEDPRVIAAENKEITKYYAVCGVAKCGGLGAYSRCGGLRDTGAVSIPVVFADGRPGETIKNYITVCGVSRCGQISNSSRCGNFEGSKILPPDVTIPDDVWTWPLIYILERTDGEFAEIPIELQDAYEFLTYKIKPNMMWAISRVEYIETPQIVKTFIKLTSDGKIKLTGDGKIKTVQNLG